MSTREVRTAAIALGLIEHAAAIYAGRVAIAAARYRLHPPPLHRPAERVIRAAARRETAAGPERTYCDGERQGRGVILAQLPASNRQVKPSRTAGRTNLDFRHYPLRRRPPPPHVLRLHQLVTNERIGVPPAPEREGNAARVSNDCGDHPRAVPHAGG